MGIGFDVHRTDPDRELVLGGVTIENSPFGLTGHSDADVVLHAIADALLGALALGDIGRHFPDDDPAWEGADSRVILGRVIRFVRERGWAPGNVDVVVIAELPRLAPHIEAMRRSIAAVLDCPRENVSVKATTYEGLGPLGGAEGIAAHAVITVVPVEGEGTDG